MKRLSNEDRVLIKILAWFFGGMFVLWCLAWLNVPYSHAQEKPVGADFKKMWDWDTTLSGEIFIRTYKPCREFIYAVSQYPGRGHPLDDGRRTIWTEENPRRSKDCMEPEWTHHRFKTWDGASAKSCVCKTPPWLGPCKKKVCY